GDQVVDQAAVGLGPCLVGQVGELVQQPAQPAQRQQARQRGPQHLQQVGGQHLGGGDDGKPGKDRILLQVGADPAGGGAVDRFLHILAPGRGDTVGQQDQHPVGRQPVGDLLDPLDTDAV